MRKNQKKRPQRPLKLSQELREYLAYMGGLGGQKSRRWLSRTHAKEMVAIREAKRLAVKEGRLEWASERIPLSKEKFSPIHRRPSVRPRRLMGTLGADSM